MNLIRALRHYGKALGPWGVVALIAEEVESIADRVSYDAWQRATSDLAEVVPLPALTLGAEPVIDHERAEVDALTTADEVDAFMAALAPEPPTPEIDCEHEADSLTAYRVEYRTHDGGFASKTVGALDEEAARQYVERTSPPSPFGVDEIVAVSEVDETE